MSKQKMLLFVPLLVIAGMLAYTWSNILLGNSYAHWKHLLATVLFIVPGVMFFRHFKVAILTTGCFLILGSINLLAIMPEIVSTSYWIEFKPVKISTPKLQLTSFVLFILFCILNFKTLVDLYLDYKGYKDEQSTNKS